MKKLVSLLAFVAATTAGLFFAFSIFPLAGAFILWDLSPLAGIGWLQLLRLCTLFGVVFGFVAWRIYNDAS